MGTLTDNDKTIPFFFYQNIIQTALRFLLVSFSNSNLLKTSGGGGMGGGRRNKYHCAVLIAHEDFVPVPCAMSFTHKLFLVYLLTSPLENLGTVLAVRRLGEFVTFLPSKL